MHNADSGAPKGNQNALMHGRYIGHAIADRRYFRALVREARDLLQEL
jgi:glucans biosynthesis protein